MPANYEVGQTAKNMAKALWTGMSLTERNAFLERTQYAGHPVSYIGEMDYDRMMQCVGVTHDECLAALQGKERQRRKSPSGGEESPTPADIAAGRVPFGWPMGMDGKTYRGGYSG